MELDHLFVRVPKAEAHPGGALFERLHQLGLVPTYRRRHEGQGTANVCYAFENAYLELLFFVADDEDGDARTQLRSRSCPVGIAVRGEVPFSTWDYRFDALPADKVVRVAEASDDGALPFVFVGPGGVAPVNWPAEKQRGLQSAAGFSRLEGVELTLSCAGHPLLETLERAGVARFHGGESTRLRVRIGELDVDLLE